MTKITPADVTEWNAALETCPHATYFHSYEWADVWRQYKGVVPRAKRIEFSDGRTLILPCSYLPSRHGLRKQVFMSPAGTFGGALYNAGITEAHLALVVGEIKKFAHVAWRQNPYEPLLHAVWPADARKDVTHALELSDSFETLYKSWTKGHRSAVHKARREGVAVKLASTLEDWLAYYRIYEDSLRRWGDQASSSYEWKLFHDLCLRNSARMKLWVAMYQQTIIAGALCFYTNKHVAYWHGAALEQYFHLRPVNLLLFEAIQHACTEGYTWFDFNPSGGHEGVAKFKQSFGGKVYESSMLIHKSILTKAIESIGKPLIWLV